MNICEAIDRAVNRLVLREANGVRVTALRVHKADRRYSTAPVVVPRGTEGLLVSHNRGDAIIDWFGYGEVIYLVDHEFYRNVAVEGIA